MRELRRLRGRVPVGRAPEPREVCIGSISISSGCAVATTAAASISTAASIGTAATTGAGAGAGGGGGVSLFFGNTNTTSTKPIVTPITKPLRVVISVCTAFGQIVSHRCTNIGPISAGRGRTNFETLNAWQTISHVSSSTTMNATGLTTVRISGYEIGRRAALMLTARLAGKDVSPTTVDLGFEIVSRESA